MIIKRGSQTITLPFPEIGHANCRWVDASSTIKSIRFGWDEAAEPTYYILDVDAAAGADAVPAGFDRGALSWLFGFASLSVIVSGGEMYSPELFREIIRARSFAGAIIPIVLSRDQAHDTWYHFAFGHSRPTADILQIHTVELAPGEELTPDYRVAVHHKPRIGGLAS